MANEIWMQFLKNWIFDHKSIGHKLIDAFKVFTYIIFISSYK